MHRPVQWNYAAGAKRKSEFGIHGCPKEKTPGYYQKQKEDGASPATKRKWGVVPNKVMKINYTELGKRIKQVREEREISQEKLAEIAGILIQKVSEIENGKTKMKLQEFMNIADALDTTIDVLLFGK